MVAHKVSRVICVACIIFGFVLVGDECLAVMDWTSMLGVVASGVAFYILTFMHPKNNRKWPVIALVIILALWSLQVYAIFVAEAMTANPHGFKNVPQWMNDSAPYVFALVPLIILWIPRFVFGALRESK